MLDPAFEALKTYDWGKESKPLDPIGEAIFSTREDAAARKALETRLADTLKTEMPRDAKEWVCRKLMVIGTAASVPNLAELLKSEDHAHMSRYALERIPDAEAGKALRDALPAATGKVQIGIISSLGVRKDTAAIGAIAKLLGSDNGPTACAAAIALGTIGTAEAAKAIASAKVSDATKSAITDANLKCAERLLAAGNKGEALAIYKLYAGEGQPKHVRLAGTRGMLACAGKKE